MYKWFLSGFLGNTLPCDIVLRDVADQVGAITHLRIHVERVHNKHTVLQIHTVLPFKCEDLTLLDKTVIITNVTVSLLKTYTCVGWKTTTDNIVLLHVLV